MSLETSRARSRGNAEMPDPASSSQPLDNWENEGGSFNPSAAREIRGVLEARVLQTQPVDARPRSYLLHALKGALDGAELNAADLEAGIMHPENLTGHESDAWEQLHHWAEEADVRARDNNYSAFHLDWLRDLHSKLTAAARPRSSVVGLQRPGVRRAFRRAALSVSEPEAVGPLAASLQQPSGLAGAGQGPR